MIQCQPTDHALLFITMPIKPIVTSDASTMGTGVVLSHQIAVNINLLLSHHVPSMKLKGVIQLVKKHLD